jgi:dTDP-glucose 4,6-dehydratase
MRLLVTGGYGFIGSNLVRLLLSPEAREVGLVVEKVVNLDKMTYAANPENLADLAGDDRHIPVTGDIGDSALVASLLSSQRIDAVIHLAAESHVDRSIDDPGAFVQTNVVGTFRLLEASRAYSKQYTNSENPRGFIFLHVSTDEVYGSLGPDEAAFAETHPYAPNSPYSASKAASDHFARAHHHTYGLPVITTNCSNNYGPRQFPEKLIPLMISKLLRGEKLPIYGDGQQRRDWLFVDDHCRALVAALLRGKPGEVYNIGGRCELTNLEVVERLITLVAEFSPSLGTVDPATRIQFVADRPGHDRRYAIDATKIERTLGWRPLEDAGSGFRKTVQWYLDNQVWVDRILAGTYRGGRLGSLT